MRTGREKRGKVMVWISLGKRQEWEEKGEDDGKKDGERENCRCRQFWQARQGGLCGDLVSERQKNFLLRV